MRFEDYGGIVNLGTSIYEYFGLQASGQPDDTVSSWLKTNQFECIVVILLDGMGISIIENTLSGKGFFRSRLAKKVTTVFPPTTTAATTSFLSGMYPKETGWLGWNQYFKEKDDQIIPFLERSMYGDEVYPGFVAEAIPVRNIVDELNRNGIHASSVWPAFGASYPSRDYDEFLKNIGYAVSEQDCRFVYAYWDEPDGFMHMCGPEDKRLPFIMRSMEEKTEAMIRNLPEGTGVMIIADHSQIAVKHYDLKTDADLCECFSKAPSLEFRAASFYIKDSMKDRFERLFSERFKDSFLLLTHEEAVNSCLFGNGKPHPRFEDFIGDYLAVALTPLQLDYLKGKDLKGNHAGGMKEESLIPLILACSCESDDSDIK